MIGRLSQDMGKKYSYYFFCKKEFKPTSFTFLETPYHWDSLNSSKPCLERSNSNTLFDSSALSCDRVWSLANITELYLLFSLAYLCKIRFTLEYYK